MRVVVDGTYAKTCECRWLKSSYCSRRAKLLSPSLQAVCMKRESMERDLGNRMTEAQQAVRCTPSPLHHTYPLPNTPITPSIPTL